MATAGAIRSLGRLILPRWASAGGRVLIGQPLHEGHRRIPGTADLVADGIERPRQPLQVVQVQLGVAQRGAGRVACTMGRILPSRMTREDFCELAGRFSAKA
jgi:hypothetical protein